MSMNTKRTIVGAIAAAVALTSFSIEPVRAASVSHKAPVVSSAKADTALTDVSTRKRRAYRGSNPAAAMAMFGIVAGSIAAISASRRHRHYYSGGYYPYGYAPSYAPSYGYGYAPGYRSYGGRAYYPGGAGGQGPYGCYGPRSTPCP